MVNAFRTTFLLAALTGIFMAVGYLVGGTEGMILAFGVALVTNLIGYWNSDKMVLRLQHAQEVDPRRVPELFDIVEGLARRAGIPMPRLYLIDTEQPNAFATGRNPQNAAVAVSTGLLRNLDRREVAAVIAHEIAHIRSRDTLIMTITGTFAGAISMLAQFGLFFGGRNAQSPLGPFGTLIAVLVAPLAAMMVQMAVSRTREYEADRDGAMISGDPLALASALGKISQMSRHFENPWARRNPGMAHLYIVNPLAGDRMDNLFATHPDVNNRIAALQKLAAELRTRDVDYPEVATPASPQRRYAPGPHGGRAWRVPPVTRDHGLDRARGPWG